MMAPFDPCPSNEVFRVARMATAKADVLGRILQFLLRRATLSRRP